MADVILPAQVKDLIANLLNPHDDVYIRQSFRDRLIPIARAINDALGRYDVEFRKVTSTRPQIKGKRNSK